MANSIPPKENKDNFLGGVLLPKVLRQCFVPSCQEHDVRMKVQQQETKLDSHTLKAFLNKDSDSPDGIIISVPTAVTESASSSESPDSIPSPISTNSTFESGFTAQDTDLSRYVVDKQMSSELKPEEVVVKEKEYVVDMDINTKVNRDATRSIEHDRDNSSPNSDSIVHHLNLSSSLNNGEHSGIVGTESKANKNKDEMTILRTDTSSSSAEHKKAMECHSISNKLDFIQSECSNLVGPLGLTPCLKKSSKENQKKSSLSNHKSRNIVNKEQGRENFITKKSHIMVTGLRHSKRSKQGRVQTPKEQAQGNLNSKVIYSRSNINNWGSTPPRIDKRNAFT